MQYHDVVGGDGVAVYLDCVGAIFLGVCGLDGVGGELAGLAYGHEACTQLEGQDGTADKSSALDAHYFSNTFVAVKL